MDDIGFMFLMFLIIILGICFLILFTNILQCICITYCHKKEPINTLNIRTIENPIVCISNDEDPKVIS